AFWIAAALAAADAAGLKPYSAARTISPVEPRAGVSPLRACVEAAAMPAAPNNNLRRSMTESPAKRHQCTTRRIARHKFGAESSAEPLLGQDEIALRDQVVEHRAGDALQRGKRYEVVACTVEVHADRGVAAALGKLYEVRG